MSWIPFAFIRIVLFFIGGILLYIFQPGWLSLNSCIFFLLLSGLTFAVLSFANNRAGRVIVNPGFAGLAMIFFAGFACTYFQTASNDTTNLIHGAEPAEYYTVVVNQHTEQRRKSWKVYARVDQRKTKEGWVSTTGEVLLYFSRAEFPMPPDYGDVLLIKGSPQKVPSPGNPGEFDYRRFLSLRQIYHQDFIKDQTTIVKLGNRPPSVVMKQAIAIRVWAENKLKQYVPGEREQNVATALVLGVTDGLDNELLDAYAATGSMHVLAVSGLHIAILYWIILLVFKPLSKFSQGRWILAGISIVILWVYAFITGLSPSVLRAVTMFSFVALAKPWNKSTNIYNTLAASAFCLLVYDPYFILSVGFQLSYLAVIGIVYLHPALYRLWEPRSWFWDEIWKMTSVSIVAQVATFPLGLLYFHQFPMYFLLSNLVVIPGSSVVLIMGLAILAVSFISTLASGAGIVLSALIKVINLVVFAVEDLPFNLLDNIYITPAQSWLLFLLVISLIVFVERRKFSYLWIPAGIVLLFSGIQWWQLVQQNQVSKLVVYKVPNFSAVDLIHGGRSTFIKDSTLNDNADKIRFHIQPNRLINGVSAVESADVSSTRETAFGKVIWWRGKSILYCLNPYEGDYPKIQVDYLIIGHDSVRDLPGLLSSVSAQQIILDSSNSFRYASKVLRRTESLNLTVYSVLHNGAFDQTFEL
jgi:competence protein ComEC